MKSDLFRAFNVPLFYPVGHTTRKDKGFSDDEENR